jgi:hypothetical protein
MLCPASRSSHRWSSWLLVLAPRRPGRRRRRPPQARSELLGHDLDDLPGAAVLVGPGPLLEAAHDHDPATKLPKDRRPAPLPEGLRFYDLRSTCASLLIAQGASVKAVQAQLGHATASITLDTYGHLFPSGMEALADRLEMIRDAALGKRARTRADPRITAEVSAGGLPDLVAEAEGFEPSRELPPYTLSRRVPSTARPSLRRAVYAALQTGDQAACTPETRRPDQLIAPSLLLLTGSAGTAERRAYSERATQFESPLVPRRGSGRPRFGVKVARLPRIRTT